MDGISNIEVGRSMTPEAWFSARDHAAKLFPAFAEFLREFDVEGCGEADAEQLMKEIQIVPKR